jgi:hypothetical protein
MKKIFLAMPSDFPAPHRASLEKIINFFKKEPAYELSLELQWLTKKFKVKDFFEAETHALENSDYLVAEISYPSVGVGYLIAHAVMRKKKILCLYKENIHKSISSFITSIPKNKITVKKYDNDTLEPILSDYFATTKPFKLYKFNFVISQKIKDYIDWLATDTKASVSEQLRNIVEEKIINQDKKYQDFIEKKH